MSLLDCGIAGLVDMLIAYSSVAPTIAVRADVPSVDRMIGLCDQHPRGRVLAPSSVHLMMARPICRFVLLIRPFMGFGLCDCDLACWCSGIVLRSTPNGPTDCWGRHFLGRCICGRCSVCDQWPDAEFDYLGDRACNRACVGECLGGVLECVWFWWFGLRVS